MHFPTLTPKFGRKMEVLLIVPMELTWLIGGGVGGVAGSAVVERGCFPIFFL